MANTATAEEVWALLRELAVAQSTLTEAQKETDRQLKDLGRRFGDFGNRLGEFVEGMVKPAVVRLFKERGIAIHEVQPNVSAKRNGEAMEIDLLVVNDSEAVVVEVKSKLTFEYVDRHLQRLVKFKRVFPRYSDFRAMGAVAAMVIPDEVRDYAYNNGLFVLAPAGESVAILNAPDFQPKYW